jgi:beta-glucosidase
VGQQTFSQGVSPKDFSAEYETVCKPDESGEIVFRIKALGKCDLSVNNESVYHSDGSWQTSNIRVPFQVEKGKEYRIEYRFMRDPDRTDASLDFTIGKEHPVNYDALIKKLKDVDLVIFAGGISPQLEGEEMPILLPGFKGGDRTDIELPASQRNCLKALKAAGKKIIFVNCSGSAIGLVPETETCDVILQAWYSGEFGGQAIADVLFGDCNPGGKLPVTFYKSISQVPDFEDYAMKGRTYRYMTEKPLFPFGYGLSYTTFDIGNATANKNTIQAGDSLTVTIPVSNTGKRDGAEVVQIYLRKLNDPTEPIKTLRAFQRVELKAGNKQNVTINLPPSTFETFDAADIKVKVSSGKYELLYGDSSDDKDLKAIAMTVL